ncbi:SET domain-containing protein-lysine N-methyltransferase [Crocosphaera sp.]|uniref:SET domain-containing protein-lysine N-methyltransferase n=1 Tax=Crocosphaera sp. TaxID=2729996 RepID=UPI0026352D52|nr:SET domain-containing protein-lysine N-methyltransferase [Crocosphaera sp.]MDJ0582496.1 SET domain-containing protein-lysine N-methyltransferase [Crocosphaera sp.]
MIEIQKILDKGRGVICTQQILKGTVIEIAPVSVIPHEQICKIDGTEVFKYYFVQVDEYADSSVYKAYLVFGLVSLSNHSEDPNSEVSWVENEVGLWCHWIATKNIEPGEEVTLCYANFEEYLDIHSTD